MKGAYWGERVHVIDNLVDDGAAPEADDVIAGIHWEDQATGCAGSAHFTEKKLRKLIAKLEAALPVPPIIGYTDRVGDRWEQLPNGNWGCNRTLLGDRVWRESSGVTLEWVQTTWGPLEPIARA